MCCYEIRLMECTPRITLVLLLRLLCAVSMSRRAIPSQSGFYFLFSKMHSSEIVAFHPPTTRNEWRWGFAWTACLRVSYHPCSSPRRRSQRAAVVPLLLRVTAARGARKRLGTNKKSSRKIELHTNRVPGIALQHRILLPKLLLIVEDFFGSMNKT